MHNLDERYAAVLSRWVADGMDYLRRGYADGSTALVSSSIHSSNWVKIIDLPNDIGRLRGEPEWSVEYRDGQWRTPTTTLQQMEALAAARLVEIEQMAKERKADEALMVDAKKKIAELRDILARERSSDEALMVDMTKMIEDLRGTIRDQKTAIEIYRAGIVARNKEVKDLETERDHLRSIPPTIATMADAVLLDIINGQRLAVEEAWTTLDRTRAVLGGDKRGVERAAVRDALRKQWTV